jgi:hypothetical protein
MIIDLHVHTVFSGDALMSPEDLIERALALGLDGVAVTEHDSYAASEATAELAEGSGLVVFRGIEVTTDIGHILVYGVEDDEWQTLRGSPPQSIPAQAFIEYVVERGGIAIPAHPFRETSPSVGERVTSLVGITAVEGFNGQCFSDENVRAVEVAKQYGLNIIGGSGAHTLGELARCVTRFDHRFESLSELVAKLKAGRFRGRY